MSRVGSDRAFSDLGFFILGLFWTQAFSDTDLYRSGLSRTRSCIDPDFSGPGLVRTGLFRTRACMDLAFFGPEPKRIQTF